MTEKRVTEMPISESVDYPGSQPAPQMSMDLDPYCLPGGVVVSGGDGRLTPVDSYMSKATPGAVTWRPGR